MYSYGIKRFIEKNYMNLGVYDEKLFDEFANCLKKDMNLDGYLEGIVEERLSRSSFSTVYDSNDLVLAVDMGKLESEVFNMVNSGIFKEYNMDRQSFYVIQSILKSVKHIRDMKDMDSNRLTKEKIALMHGYMARLGNWELKQECGNRVNLDVADRFFRFNSDIFPEERYAQIDSLWTLINIYKDLAYKSNEAESDYRIWCAEVVANGYVKDNYFECPLKSFYSLLGMDKEFKPLSYYSLSTMDKLMYGSYVSEELLERKISDILGLDYRDDSVKKLCKRFIK